MSPDERIVVIVPNYAMANLWAKNHEVARRRMKVILRPEMLEGLSGPVHLYWPPSSPDPHGLMDALLDKVSQGVFRLRPCTELVPELT